MVHDLREELNMEGCHADDANFLETISILIKFILIRRITHLLFKLQRKRKV